MRTYPIDGVPAVFDWNEGSGIYRDVEGCIVLIACGTSVRANRWFLANVDGEPDETKPVFPLTVHRRGEHENESWFASAEDGREWLIRVTNAQGYESEAAYDLYCATHWTEKRPRQSWLKITGILKEPIVRTGLLTPASTIKTDQLAERSRLQRQAREQAASRSDFVKQVDAQRQEERRAEKPSVDLSDPASVEDLYFNGPGFNGNPK